MENLRLNALEKEAAVAQERTFLARELHDSIAQSLAFLKIQVQLMRDALDSGDAAAACERVLGEIDTGVRESYGDVRELLVHFRTRANAEDIEPALQTTLRKFEHQSGLKAAHADGGPRHAAGARPAGPGAAHRAGGAVQRAQARAARRRSGSTSQQQPQWRFEVRDDGVGLRRRRRAAPTRRTSGCASWPSARSASAPALDVLSTPGRGTSIVLTLPPSPPGRPPRRRRRPPSRCTDDDDARRPAGRSASSSSTTTRCSGAGSPRCWRAIRSFEVVGDAADAGEALRRAQELQPDLILLDNHLPGVNGVDALPALREAAPGARVLMLTVSEDEQDLATALRDGACGYLLKTIEGDALVTAIVRAMRGESVVADEMTGKLVAAYRDAAAPRRAGAARRASPLAQLSPREQEILRGIARGASNKEIARELGIAETTVKIHVQHVLRKLDVASRVQAAVIATEHGLG